MGSAVRRAPGRLSLSGGGGKVKAVERGVVYATRKFTFSAAHRYWRSEWTPEENKRAFGSLTTVHGHNYSLEVTVRGTVNERTGMVMNLAELKRVVGDAVIQRFDHSDLNQDPLFANGVIPTTENLVREIWDLLVAKFGPDCLWRLRLWEDPTFYVEYYGS
jgi:6-pyruvoyltetrahydropterin/6-carboxytetrahydropterin synthase